MENKTYIEPFISHSRDADLKLAFEVENEDVSSDTFTSDIVDSANTTVVTNANITTTPTFNDPHSQVDIECDKAQLTSLKRNEIYALIVKNTTEDETPVRAKLTFV